VKSDVETLSPTRVKLTIEVPFDELKPSLDAAYGRIAQNVNIPGFRKGKVPARIIEQRFGRGAVLEEAVNDAIPKAYEDAVRDTKIVPISRPEIDVTAMEDGDKLTFTAEVDVRPEFDLPDFSSLKVEVAPAVPSIDDVAQQVEALRTRFATLTEVERAAANGDVLLVDIAGATEDGDPVEDLSGKALSYELGTDGMLPGFDEAVRGASKGDTVVLDFTPQNGDWSGINLKASITVAGVRERVLPALDDSFAQLASEFDTVAELNEDIKTRLMRVKRLEQGAEARTRALDVLVEAVDMPIPENVVAAEVEAHFEDGHEGDEAHRAEVETQARSSLKSQFILDKIAENEDLSVEESELSQWLIQQAPRYGMSPDQFAQALVEANQVGMAMQDIRRAKALAVVLETASIVDSEGAIVDLSALDEEINRAAGPQITEIPAPDEV
jgi:trigger factor